MGERVINYKGLKYLLTKLKPLFASKQDKLIGIPDRLIGFDSNSAVKPSIYPSNKNLLINWYLSGGGSQQGTGQFPINQNGKIEYSGNGYTIDGFNNNGLNIKLEQKGLTIVNTDSIDHRIWQNTEMPMLESLLGQVVTVSILYKTDYNNLYIYSGGDLSGPSGGYHSNGSATLAKSEKWNLETYSFVIRKAGEQISFQLFGLTVPPGASASIWAVKTELGPVQTLAHRENGEWVLNEIPNYAEQYAICSQYDPVTGYFVGNQHSNPNLLNNWYFLKPINQKGGTKYSGGYGIDRWSEQTSTGSVELTDLGLKCSNTYLRQFFEDDEFFKGKRFTFSVLTADNQLLSTSGTVPSTITSGTYIIPSVSGANLTIGVFVYPISSGILIGALIVASLTGNTLVATKLELGPVQTLAHKDGDTWVLNDPPPDYALELEKCLEYQVNCSGIYSGVTNVETNSIIFYVPTPIPLRANSATGLVLNNCIIYDDSGITTGVTATVDGAYVRSTGVHINAKAIGYTIKEYKQIVIDILYDSRNILDSNL